MPAGVDVDTFADIMARGSFGRFATDRQVKEQTSAFRAEGALKAISQSSPVLSMK